MFKLQLLKLLASSRCLSDVLIVLTLSVAICMYFLQLNSLFPLFLLFSDAYLPFGFEEAPSFVLTQGVA